MVLRQFESKLRTAIFVVLYDDGLCTSTSSCYFYFVLNLTNLIKMFLLCKCQCMYYCLLDLKSQMQYVFLFTWFEVTDAVCVLLFTWFEVTDAVWVLLVHDLKSQMQFVFFCLHDLKSQMQYVFFCLHDLKSQMQYVFFCLHDLKSQMQYVFLCSHMQFVLFCSHMQFVFFCLHDMKSQMQYVFFNICLYQILTALTSWRLCLLQCESAFRIISILF